MLRLGLTQSGRHGFLVNLKILYFRLVITASGLGSLELQLNFVRTE